MLPGRSSYHVCAVAISLVSLDSVLGQGVFQPFALLGGFVAGEGTFVEECPKLRLGGFVAGGGESYCESPVAGGGLRANKMLGAELAF